MYIINCDYDIFNYIVFIKVDFRYFNPVDFKMCL